METNLIIEILVKGFGVGMLLAYSSIFIGWGFRQLIIFFKNIINN